MKLVERARAAAVEALMKDGRGAAGLCVAERHTKHSTSAAVEAALAVVGELEEVEVEERRNDYGSGHWLLMPDDCRRLSSAPQARTIANRTIYMAPLTPKPTVEELMHRVVDAWQEEGNPTWHKFHVAMAALAEKLAEKLDKP